MADTEPGVFGGTEVQDLGRRINNRIRRRVGPEQGNSMWLVCECANGDCEAMIHITVEQYVGVRKDDYHFLVLAGHQVTPAERVVEGAERWLVVELVDQYRRHVDLTRFNGHP